MFSRITVAGLAVVALTACGGSPQQAAPAVPAAATATPPAAQAGPALSITDPWVKTAKKGMSAAFGTLVNNSGTDVVVVSGATPLSPAVELHEVVESAGKSVMRPKEGGFVIPAHGRHELKPGGDHIMLMDLAQEVRPGDEISFTLTLKDGGTFAFKALGKDFAGAKEDYQPGMDMGSGEGH
ncbi:copper chaperone PCu(A)C [Nonomuraea bangladeshensis]|uniref:copper chaperone PCu(A)C n=1 Tax=Nonomuraea bangladeshensis TaxID=404385 RepID=UPI0031DB7B51